MAKPKLALIPAAQGSKFYSVLPSDGVGDFDFARASAATRINKYGLIETVASGQSRLNYPLIDGVVKGCPHHILEPARTNLIQYSEDFDNAYWTNTEETTVNTSVAVSPDGESNADKLIPQATSNFHRLSRSFTVTTATTYTFSAFVKRAGYDYFLIRTSDAANNNIGYDLLNGTVTYTASGYTSFIESYGNDWYRIGFVRSFTASSITINFRPNPTIISTNALDNITGDGTSGAFVWGAQLELGSYPTSYIVSNSGSATTRVAETANNSGDVSTFNDSEGVLMAEISALANDGTFRFISLSDGTSSNRISLFFSTSNTLNAGGNGITSIGGVSGIENNNKVAFKYKSGDYALWVNGIEVGTSTVTTGNHANLNRLNFDFGQGSDDFYGNTKQIQYFDSALNDSELETLTSWTSFSEMATSQLYTIQ
jgi:hypothetical protein